MRNIRIVLSAISVYCLLLGCSFLFGCSTQASKTHIYTLHATLAGSDNIKSISDGAIGVGPIVLPESLARSEIVSFAGRNQVLVDSKYRWAGGLKQSLSRVLASNLSGQLGDSNVWPFPWDVRTRPNTQVSIVLERLGGQLGGLVQLKAKWRILAEQGSKVLLVGHCEFEEEAENTSYDAYVAAINNLVQSCSVILSQNIAPLL